MSLVENIVSQISTNGLGGVTKPQGFDLNDDTFEKILQGVNGVNSGQNILLNEKLQALGNLGQPSGLVIEPFENTEPIQPISNDKQNVITSEPLQIKDVDMGSNYFSNLLKEAPEEHKNLMSVVQKHASNMYNSISRNLVEDLVDFAKDITSLS